MKKLLLFLGLLWLNAAMAQCPPGDVIFTSQEQVNAFIIQYPDCTELGNVKINSTYPTPPIHNLNGLDNITAVHGDFIIDDDGGMDVTGLSSLTTVDGIFRLMNIGIQNIAALSNLNSVGGLELIDVSSTTLAPLSNLQHIGGNLIIRFYSGNENANIDIQLNITEIEGDLEIGSSIYNGLADTSFLLPITAVGGNVTIRDGFANYNGFSNITSIGGDLEINLYDAFEDSNTFEGLSGITNVPGNLKIKHFGVTSFEGLSNIATVGGNIDIYVPYVTSFNLPLTSVGGYVSINSFEMNDISGLANLTTIPGELKLLNLLILDFSPLNNLTSVGGIYLENLKNIHNLDGFSNLTQINGQLYINNCIELSSLQALSNVTSLNGNLTITGNTWLQALLGLQNITTINNNDLKISNNYLLTDISGIQNLNPDFIKRLYIENNQNLAICAYANLCAFKKYNTVNITGNAEGCSLINCYNTIKGVVKSFTAGSSCASGIVAKDIKVKCTDSSGNTYITFTKYNGTYEILVPVGNYITTAYTDLTNYTFETPQFSDDFGDTGNTVMHDFCMSAPVNEDKFKLSIIPLTKPGPGTDARYVIKFKNVGTNGTGPTNYKPVVIHFNPQKLHVLGSGIEVDNQEGTYTWKTGSSLMPFQESTLELRFTVLDAPQNNENDLVIIEASGAGTNATFSQSLKTSNDIYRSNNVLEGNQVLIGDADNYLHYLLNLNLVDDLSPYSHLINQFDEKLDSNTFEVLYSEGGYTADIINNRLDVKTGTERLVYRIKPKPGIQAGDIISNFTTVDGVKFANTNTVETEFVTVLGNDTVSLKESKLYVYPNPTSSILNFESSEIITEVVIYSSIGHQVLHINNSSITQADVSMLSEGVYICRVVDANGKTSTRKIIVNK